MRTTFKEIDPRPRINQPKGYEDSQYSSSLIRGKRHDYIFLPQGYKDPDTGKGGANTIISRAKSEERVPLRKQWYESDLIDVETLAEVELESLNK